MHWHKCKGRVRLAIDVEDWSHTIAKFANVGDEAGAGLNDLSRLQRRVDDANVRRMLRTRRRTGFRVEVRLTAKVQCNMLFGD